MSRRIGLALLPAAAAFLPVLVLLFQYGIRASIESSSPPDWLGLRWPVVSAVVALVAALAVFALAFTGLAVRPGEAELPMRRAVSRILLVMGYAGFAFMLSVFLGGQIPVCLGIGPTFNAACVAAWYAGLNPIDRFLYDLPRPYAPVFEFVGLVLVAFAVVLIWRHFGQLQHDRASDVR